MIRTTTKQGGLVFPLRGWRPAFVTLFGEAGHARMAEKSDEQCSPRLHRPAGQ